MNTKFRSSCFKYFQAHHLPVSRVASGTEDSVATLLLFTLVWTPHALMQPHINQPLMYLQALLGVGGLLKRTNY